MWQSLDDYDLKRELKSEEIAIIRSVFPEELYTIHIDNCNVKIYKKNSNALCILFTIKDNHIYISTLNRCDDIRGYQSLINIFNLAQQLQNIEYIRLIDASEILICANEISLTTIKILTTGHSWYNSLGYKSKNYENEQRVNQIIIEKEYNKFLDTVLESLITKYSQNLAKNIRIKEKLNKIIQDFKTQNPETQNPEIISKKKLLKNIESKIKVLTENKDNYISSTTVGIEELKADGMRLFPNIDITTIVKEYFSSIWSKITKDIESKGCADLKLIEQCDWLSKLISIIKESDILTYDTELKKVVTQETMPSPLQNIKSSNLHATNSLGGNISRHRLARANDRATKRTTRGGMASRKKKYKRRNKTRQYKRQIKRYTKKYRMRY